MCSQAGKPVRKLFSKEQRAFYDEHAPEGITLDDVVALGPIPVLKVKFAPPALRRRMVAEMWFYPDGSRILELSTKCPPADALDVADEARDYLSGRGVDLGGEQQTKTRTALRFYSKELTGTGAASVGQPIRRIARQRWTTGCTARQAWPAASDAIASRAKWLPIDVGCTSASRISESKWRLSVRTCSADVSTR